MAESAPVVSVSSNTDTNSSDGQAVDQNGEVFYLISCNDRTTVIWTKKIRDSSIYMGIRANT